MRVYIIDQLDQYILELSLILTKSLGVVTTIDHELSSIDKFIDNGLDADVVIFNEKLFNRNEVNEVYKKINLKKNNFPIISRSDSSYNYTTLDSSNIEKNIETIGNILKNKKNQLSGKFVAISVNKLLAIEPHNIGCDLFIKILKNGKDHYVKRLHSNDQFTKKDIEKYIQHGLKEFYIPEEQYEIFINILTMELIKTYQAEKDNSLDYFQVYSTTFEIICERIKLFGVDDLLNNLVDEYTRQIKITLQNENELIRFIEKLKNKNHTFAFTHSYFCAFLTYQLTIHYEWQSEQTKEIFLYLSLFHDISLLDTELSKYNKQEEIEFLEEKTKERILNHANDSANIVEKFNNIPFGLTQMIREHHGEKDGIGFTKSLSINISPMVMAFIVIEEFAANYIYYFEQNPKMGHEKSKVLIKNLVQNLEKNYSKLTYQKTVQELAVLLKKLEII